MIYWQTIETVEVKINGHKVKRERQIYCVTFKNNIWGVRIKDPLNIMKVESLGQVIELYSFYKATMKHLTLEERLF